jgi:phosphoglucosamine mutase
MSQQKYFGTDGIRGAVGEDFINPKFMLKLGWAAGMVLGQEANAKILIGRDTRNSGYMLQSALTAGLTAAGVDVNMLGIMPTPAIAYLTHSLRAQAGIVISASHNPYYDNGVKFFDAQGMKLSDELECAIGKYLDKDLQIVPTKDLGAVTRLTDVRGRYVEFCKSIFPEQLTLKGLKCVIDCAHGATFKVAPTILQELGAEIITLGVDPNGFNINEKCGATDCRELQQQVKKQQADIGIAFDGDGDRLMLVDHTGDIIDGDQILCILAHDSATGIRSRQGVVGTLMSNLGLEQALAKNSIDFVRAKVGDRYVLEELIKRGWTLGGESSGHIVNLDYATTGDGIITALQVLRIMLMSNKKLAELKTLMTKRPQILINVPSKQGIDLTEFPQIAAMAKETETKLNGAGRVLLRPSGTEPYVRVMVEGNDAKVVQQTAEQLAQMVQRELN